MTQLVKHQANAMDLFDPNRYAVLERMAETLLASGMLPASLKQPAQVITIMLKSHELGVPPIEGLNGIAVIQGKPTVSPQLMLALIERSGAGSISILERSATVSVVEAHRRGRRPVQFTFTFDDAKKLGLAGKDNYQKQPAVMLQWRNVAAAARAVFPDVISGLYLPEEMGAEVEILDDGAQVIVDATFTPEPAKVTRENRLGSEPITATSDPPVALQDIPGVEKGTASVKTDTMTSKQLQDLGIITTALGWGKDPEDRKNARAFIAWVLAQKGEPFTSIASVKDLTRIQATTVINALSVVGEDGKTKLNDAAESLLGQWIEDHSDDEEPLLEPPEAARTGEEFRR